MTDDERFIAISDAARASGAQRPYEWGYCLWCREIAADGLPSGGTPVVLIHGAPYEAKGPPWRVVPHRPLCAESVEYHFS